MFEKYIIDSNRLWEIPQIINIFGVESTIELFKSGKISINNESFKSYGQIGQVKSDFFPRSNNLPLNSFLFEPIEIIPYESEHERKSIRNKSYSDVQGRFISNELKIIDDIGGINRAQTKILKREIASNIVHFKNRSFLNLINQRTIEDLKLIHPIIRKSICQQIKQTVNLDYHPEDLELEIDIIDESPIEFRVNSNLEKELGIEKEKIHQIIQSAMFAVIRMNLRFIQMREFDSQIGFREDEIQLFDETLREQLTRNSETQLKSDFTKIIKLKALPDLDQAIQNEKIDIIKVLEITESKEWIEFRNWLFKQDSIDEEQLMDNINSLPQKFRDIYETDTAKILSFLTITGAGIINPIAGVGLGIIHTFILDKLLPNNSAITFINNKLPTIFKTPSFNDDIVKLHEGNKISIMRAED